MRASAAGEQKAGSSTTLASVGMTSLLRRVPSFHNLEIKLQSKLDFSRLARLQDLSERCVAEVPVRIYELGLIEKIENVSAELEVLRLRQRNPLRERNVPLIFSRTAADRTRSRCESTERWV
jgi:hypothetical protein